MSSDERKTEVRGGVLGRRVVVYAAVLVGVFLLGLVPMWLSARGRAAERDAARRELRLCRIQGGLASAALDARRGDYEPARQGASNFFNALRDQVDGDASDLAPAQRESLRPLLGGRDDLITLLARSDPASADRLSDLYASYRKAAGDAQTPDAK